MLRPNATGPRGQWTPEYLSELALEELLQIFLACAPGTDRELFKQKVYLPMCRAGVCGDATVDALNKANANKLGLAHLIQICCAYCIQCQAAAAQDRPTLALSYLMDAFLYLGMARTNMSSEPQVKATQEAVSRDALTANARHSVQVSVDPWHETAAAARRMILARVQAGERWASRAEAARAIGDDVEQFLTENTTKRFLTPKGRTETISRWLGEVPEAAHAFAPDAGDEKD